MGLKNVLFIYVIIDMAWKKNEKKKKNFSIYLVTPLTSNSTL